MKPARSPIDITNQKLGSVGSAAAGISDFSAITVGTIPVIRRFIDTSSEMNVPFSARGYDPPTISRMKSAWKIVQPKAKPRMYSRTTSAKPLRPNKLARTPESVLSGNCTRTVAHGTPFNYASVVHSGLFRLGSGRGAPTVLHDTVHSA